MNKAPEIELSIVSPVYLAERLVEELVEKLTVALQSLNISYEILLVEDGSPDRSWEKIEKLCLAYPNVKGIQLLQNHGQHPAIYAGLTHAQGNWVVVMDCDLQDNPQEIKHMYTKALEGYHLVLAQRTERKSSWFDTYSSKAFYRFLNSFSSTSFDARVAPFGLYSRAAVQDILKRWKRGSLFTVLAQKSLLKKAFVKVGHRERWIGKSSYSWMKRLKLGLKHVFSAAKETSIGERVEILKVVQYGQPIYQILDWDSQFFGWKVAEMLLPSMETLPKAIVALKSEGVRLVYLKMAQPLADLPVNGRMVGERHVYVKTIAPKQVDPHLHRCSTFESAPGLKDLVLEASRFSRFCKDPAIPKAKCEELYSLWLENSLAGKMADAVYVYQQGTHHTDGFVTVAQANHRVRICLLAVRQEKRREGLGEALLAAAENWGHTLGLSETEVSSYQFNEEACAFYRKMGFRLDKVEYFYHFWL